jgi:hypothetical protein
MAVDDDDPEVLPTQTVSVRETISLFRLAPVASDLSRLSRRSPLSQPIWRMKLARSLPSTMSSGEIARFVNRPFNCGSLASTLLNSTTGNAVALAQSELVGIVNAGRARLAYDCQLGIGHLVGRVQRDRIDAIAGVMVLSEVARRLMMMSGSGASTCSTECGRSATSRLTEVTTTTVPAGHRRPGVPGQEL